MSIFIYPFIYKLIPINAKQKEYAVSIISVIISSLFIYNIWPLLYSIKYHIFPSDYSFYFPFLSNVISFAEYFYMMRISVTYAMPDLTPIAIRNAIYNIINILVSIGLIISIPYLYNSKNINNKRNYMQEYHDSKKWDEPICSSHLV